MDPLNNTKTISPVTYLISGVALLLAGGIVGVFADPYLPSSLSNAKKGYQTGFNNAKMIVEKSDLGKMFILQDEVKTLSGRVSAVGRDSFTLHINSMDPFIDETLYDRTVRIDSSTKIVKLIQKDQKIFQEEMSTFVKDELQNIQATSTNVIQVTPSQFNSTIISLEDIKVGMPVEVVSSRDIKNVKEFVVDEVTVQP